MTECKITGLELGYGQSTTTADGEDVDRQLYKESASYYGKGYLSTKEIMKYIEVRTEHSLATRLVVRKVKRLAIKTNTDVLKVLSGVTAEENKISMERFNKCRVCLHMDEHIEVMGILLQLDVFKDLSGIKIEPVEGNRKCMVLSRYIRDMAWRSYDKFN